MLKKKRHDELPLTLTVIGQGDKITFKVVYNNLAKDQLEALQNREGVVLGEFVMAMVKSWESEYDLTLEGLIELESDRPGMMDALIGGFHEARRMNKTKN